mgnify:CR=1 FL=1
MHTEIICARGTVNVNDGDSYSGGTPETQTEAATELIINRLAVIDLLQKKEILLSDTIVTLPERMFLYENIFNNIKDYTQLKNPSKNQIDIVGGEYWQKLPYKGGIDSITSKPFYQHYERDKDLIHNISYNHNILNAKLDDFLVCIPRLKKSDTRRNLEQEYWVDFINIAKKHYKVMVFGKGNENLNSEEITYIDTLQDYCSYLHHPNCKHVVSTISGPCHYVQQFGNVNNQTILTMIDNHNLLDRYGHDPSYFDSCINFTKVRINIIKSKNPSDKPLPPQKLTEFILSHDR